MANVSMSTGLKNALATRGIKELLNGCIINIYSGSMPTSPDSAESGTKLVTITRNGNSWSDDVKQKNTFSITAAGDNGDTITVTIEPEGESSEVITYTKTSSETTTSDVAYAVSKLIDSRSVYVKAISLDDAVVMEGRFGGESFTITVAKTGNIGIDPSGELDNIVDASYGNGLHFEYSTGVSGGTLEKANETWKGSVLSNGTAQWFRIVKANDTGASSTTAIRIQGLCGTLIDSPLRFAGSTSLTSGLEVTITNFSISV